VFGQVTVSRLAYRQRGSENLYVADAELNLPEEKHSHGLRRLAAPAAPQGSFEDARDAIGRQTRDQTQDPPLAWREARSQADRSGHSRLSGHACGSRPGGRPALKRPQRQAARDGPEAKDKWVSASVSDSAATAISKMFEEALRRDPERQRTWVALVDGDNRQIDRITKKPENAS
jgi:hypothetical protein